MQSDQWAKLFRQVPVEQQNKLTLMTGAGIEITIQTLLRIEDDFLAIKGRLAGSQDAGRVYFIPYTNIDYFGFQTAVKETEFDEMFGTGPLSIPRPAAPSALLAQATQAPAASEVAAEEPSSTVSNRTPLKSEVLERFRSRSPGSGMLVRPPT